MTKMKITSSGDIHVHEIEESSAGTYGLHPIIYSTSNPGLPYNPTSATLSLWKFNGDNISAYGIDEAGNFDFIFGSSGIGGVSGYGQSQGDVTDEAIEILNATEDCNTSSTTDFQQTPFFVECIANITGGNHSQRNVFGNFKYDAANRANWIFQLRDDRFRVLVGSSGLNMGVDITGTDCEWANTSGKWIYLAFAYDETADPIVNCWLGKFGEDIFIAERNNINQSGVMSVVDWPIYTMYDYVQNRHGYGRLSYGQFLSGTNMPTCAWVQNRFETLSAWIYAVTSATGQYKLIVNEINENLNSNTKLRILNNNIYQVDKELKEIL